MSLASRLAPAGITPAGTVRHIGSTTFRDSEPRREPEKREPISPAVQRFHEARERSEGLTRPRRLLP